MSSSPYDVVFYHLWLPGHPIGAAFGPAFHAMGPGDLVAYAVAFLRRNAPAARVTIVTDDPSRFPSLPGVAFEATAPVDPAALQYERVRAYGAFIRARAGSDGGRALFVDTDVMALGDLGEIFATPFDVALTYAADQLGRPAAPPDRWGVPEGTNGSIINFGVMAARYTDAAAGFFDAVLRRFDEIVAEARTFLSGTRNMFRTAGVPGAVFRIEDVRAWGGDQFALASLLAPHVYGRLDESFRHGDALIRLLPDATWNFTPQKLLGPDILEGRRALHLKGRWKERLPEIARRLGIAPHGRG